MHYDPGLGWWCTPPAWVWEPFLQSGFPTPYSFPSLGSSSSENSQGLVVTLWSRPRPDKRNLAKNDVWRRGCGAGRRGEEGVAGNTAAAPQAPACPSGSGSP